MGPNNLPPFTQLPVQWQSVNIDVESVAPIRQFNPSEAYDVANMSAVICTDAPEARDYRLLLSCDVEAGTSATVRVMSSTDDAFDAVERFAKISTAEAKDYIATLDSAALLAPEATEAQKLQYIRANFKRAAVSIPAGRQKLRIHASQKLVTVNGDPKAYSLKVFAPLLGFTIAGGQTNLSVVVTFPPQFEGNPFTVDAPIVEQIAGQPMPAEAVPAFANVIGAVQAYAWHWRNDPKVTINYRYN